MYGYIYKTENKITGEIYIGKKKSSKFQDNLIASMICQLDNESDLNAAEIKQIKMYKDLYKDKCLNQAEGGLGGNTFKYASETDKENFSKTMTEVNSSRCKSEEFRKQASDRMREKYKDPLERLKQSEKIRKAWDDENLRKDQSDILKKYYSENPKDNSYMNKKCGMELNGKNIEFDSRKELKKYLKEEYNVTFSNPKIKELIETEASYNPFHKNKSNCQSLIGMKLYNLKKV
jgi:hypothetical protein